MIQLEDVTLSRGPQTLLEHAHATIHAGQKVGLVGANGSGKSSLFGFLLGAYDCEQGSLAKPKGLRISHIAQEIPSSDQSALEFVLDGHAPYRALEKKMKSAQAEEDYETLAYLYPSWETLGGDKIPVLAQKIMSGLGFAADQMSQPLNYFSGGWRVRLQLAKTLIHPGDLLLLDEPTNHLDLEAILWLEKWCKTFDGTLIIIAHDITFLDNIVSDILHIEHKTLHQYSGNYSTFVKTRAQKIAHTQAQAEKQQKKKEHLQKFISRFKAKASKAKQAQSRVKQLEKMEDIATLHASSPIQFEFKMVEAPNPMVRIRGGEIGYQTPLLKSVNFYLGAQDRVALLGKNGQGKSTFVKILAGQLELLSGEIHIAQSLKIGYFAQHQVEALNLDQSPLACLKASAPEMTEEQCRTFLGTFHFKQDKVFVPIGKLSGGERARLAFALLVHQKPQLILLDEPTNHLDIEMREALALALQEFNGALVVVSHDRAFIDRCCDSLILIDEGCVQNFEGTLEDYTQWTRQGTSPDKPTKRVKSQSKGQKGHDTKKRMNRIKKLEQEVHTTTQSLKKIEDSLAEPALYHEDQKEQLRTLLQQREKTQQALKAFEDEWFEAHNELENED